MKSIFIFADWFEPGYKAGGPIRSCVNFVHQMKQWNTIYILTTDRDLNDTIPYSSVEVDKWLEYDKNVFIFYCSPQQLAWVNIRHQLKNIRPDYIYLNSMFSRYFTIYPLLMARLGMLNSKIVLAPRGMLKGSALQFKSFKKKIFLSAFKQMGLQKLIHFHATDTTEKLDVQKQFGSNVQVTLVPNSVAVVKDYPGTILKKENELSIIFIGRLHPVKNLAFLLQHLNGINANVSLTIVGNAEDEAYTSYCKSIIVGYAENIKVTFAGEIPNHKLSDVLAQHHIFALPTLGENFGHAIFEALSAGRPVLISDQTPWRDLTKAQVGWDISLQRPDEFIAGLQQAIAFNQMQYDAWSKSAWQYARDFVQQSNLETAYNNIFN